LELGRKSLFEIWRPTHSHNYEVSNCGRVRRVTPATGATVGRVLKAKRKNSGYLFVCFSDSGRSSYHHIHTLVAAAFIGPRAKGMQINHIDCEKSNNRATNLEYVTPSENSRHAGRNGHLPDPTNIPRGTSHCSAKLTEADVVMARAMYASGCHSYPALGKRFGVSGRAIWKAVNGFTWKHVPPTLAA
jgi:hypothetical protein